MSAGHRASATTHPRIPCTHRTAPPPPRAVLGPCRVTPCEVRRSHAVSEPSLHAHDLLRLNQPPRLRLAMALNPHRHTWPSSPAQCCEHRGPSPCLHTVQRETEVCHLDPTTSHTDTPKATPCRALAFPRPAPLHSPSEPLLEHLVGALLCCECGLA
jgi:hypothetical protein